MDNFQTSNAQLHKLGFPFSETEDKRLEQLTDPSSTDRADQEWLDQPFFDTVSQRQHTPQRQSPACSSPPPQSCPKTQIAHCVIMQGYLQRSTGSILSRWQICYCVLTPSKLYCFQDHSRSALVSCINLTALACLCSLQERHLQLQLQEYDAPVLLRAFTLEEAAGWHRAISSIIEYNSKSGKVRFLECKRELYQQKDAISEVEFLESAESGDIVLMSTSDAQCALQRFVTNSEYDHVAMVVRFNGTVKIFEANADEGVNVYSWPQFQSEFHQYEKISVRKLHYPKRRELEPRLVGFIKGSVGKKYDLRAFKLMRRKSSEDDKRGGYFCSQLVAKVYKILGLLGGERASSSYWPVEFTVRGAMNLLDGASLGDEQLIMLKKHLRS